VDGHGSFGFGGSGFRVQGSRFKVQGSRRIRLMAQASGRTRVACRASDDEHAAGQYHEILPVEWAAENPAMRLLLGLALGILVVVPLASRQPARPR
jgi:hypothetical protein